MKEGQEINTYSDDTNYYREIKRLIMVLFLCIGNKNDLMHVIFGQRPEWIGDKICSFLGERTAQAA